MGVKAELYFNYLKEEGFLPRVDDDGDVVFKREGGTYFLKADEEDKQYFQLVFPAFWKLEDPGEDTQKAGDDRHPVGTAPIHKDSANIGTQELSEAQKN